MNNYYTIIIAVVTVIINVIAVIINVFQVKTAKTVAADIPFLEFSGPIPEGGSWKYKLINRGPGHAKNIKLSIINSDNERYECKGPTFIPYSEDLKDIEYRYEGKLVIYPTSSFVIEYQNMTGYKMKNNWKLNNGKFQIF